MIMTATGPSAKEKLKQELWALGSALASQVEAARVSTEDGDLEALQILAEGKGICRFKVKDWSEPMSMDGKTALLQTFLLLLWQNGTLEKGSYDPVDLRITREKVVQLDRPAEQNYKFIAEEIIVESTQENENKVAIAEMKEQVREEIATHDTTFDLNDIPEEIILAEDGSNYLIGPRELNLSRIDHYHPLFSQYRRSAAIRQENFLASKHLLHVRKLSGITVDFGYKFCRAVLEKAAQSLEDLFIRHHRLSELDLYLDLQFPRLHRLYIWMDERSNIQDKSSFQFPALNQDSVGLRWLCARLPRAQLKSLLRLHAKTLVELQVEVGTRSSHPPSWPMQCGDLEVLLVDCGLATGALRKLRLIRGVGSAHTRADCKLQVEAVRHNMPGVTVVCDKCCIADKSCGVDYSLEYYYPRGAWENYC